MAEAEQLQLNGQGGAGSSPAAASIPRTDRLRPPQKQPKARPCTQKQELDAGRLLSLPLVTERDFNARAVHDDDGLVNEFLARDLEIS